MKEVLPQKKFVLQFLANKIDEKEGRQVDEYKFESPNNSVQVFEVSANQNTNIKKAFDYAIQ